MDLSALIFVALAVAWAVYLVPKALKHHEESESTRTIDGFSDRLRVLARREPVDRSQARLVVPDAPRRSAQSSAVPTRRTVSAAARRRRVLGVLLIALVAVGVLAATAVLAWAWIALPLTVLVAWLVACRMMVRRERSARVVPRRPAAAAQPQHPAGEWDEETDQIDAVAPASFEDPADVPMWDPTEESVALDPDTGAPVSWDPVPVTLPTYVAKEPAARRTVRTIDLDSTGVWTSGPHAADSALARQADEDDRTARAARREQEAADAARRASGS